ncbi:hypothetical protein Poli38472_003884 [Pythium oligandrum]|uniref:Phosphatidylcholine transfer protein n=1 Tax=Pythium oligandrum TaxID=41045 RepID=A0A8K1FMB7_PYTOL|nr:hypothetical protein Poli38472_003884 [Pythium oligandrum]|eukprot:TMW66119.1 hypothetical protein Poli38472_003884 [Pythium oligandrum]
MEEGGTPAHRVATKRLQRHKLQHRSSDPQFTELDMLDAVDMGEHAAWAQLDEPLYADKDFEIYRPPPVRSALPVYYIKGWLPYSADALFNTITDIRYRSQWDKSVAEYRYVEKQKDSDVMYFAANLPWPFARRDYVYRRWTKYFSKQNSFVMICQTAHHAGAIEVKDAVRVETFSLRMSIRSTGTNSCDFYIEYEDDTNFCIPNYVVNWLLSAQVPGFMTNLRMACANYAGFAKHLDEDGALLIPFRPHEVRMMATAVTLVLLIHLVQKFSNTLANEKSVTPDHGTRGKVNHPPDQQERDTMSAPRAGKPVGPVNTVRFMQLALATTMILSIMYMWDFISVSVASTVSKSGFLSSTTGTTRSNFLGETRIVLQGFQEGYKFVNEYDVATQGPLYIFFVSDVDENGTYWCPDCQKAKKSVYDVFARAPRGSRLVEIRVGSSDYWNNQDNEFRQNELFYIDYIPSLVKYEGGGNSSFMLNEEYTLDYDLLEYMFNVPYPAAGAPKNNKIVTLDEASAVQEYVMNYDNSYPLYIFFVSGYHSFNGRLWCQYCDRANIAIMHYYNYTAPESAVMLRAVVSHSYKMWKKKKNPFKLPEFRQNVVSIRGVPYLGRVTKDAANKVVVQEFMPDFTAKKELIEFFSQPAPATP